MADSCVYRRFRRPTGGVFLLRAQDSDRIKEAVDSGCIEIHLDGAVVAAPKPARPKPTPKANKE
jgi:hypothetical protein